MPTIQEIKLSYGEDQAAIINESFALGAANGPSSAMSADLETTLGPEEAKKVRIAESVLAGDAERERLREEYERLDLEKRAAIELRVEQIERELSPGEVNFGDRLAAASASPEALITALDSALTSGNEDQALLAFQIARERDLEDVVSHAVTVREDWGDLYGELAEAAEDPGLDAGDRFEMFATKVPSKESLLANYPVENRNIYGMMR
jgi:hypothetical protein